MEKTVTIRLDEAAVDMEKYQVSPYARWFDETSPAWTKDPERNKMFLLAQQNYMNEKLKRVGCLFLNDVYEAIGLPRTKAGQVVGWIFNPDDPNRDSYVDFGIFSTDSEGNHKFVNGYENSVLLDFNVDGVILDDI